MWTGHVLDVWKKQIPRLGGNRQKHLWGCVTLGKQFAEIAPSSVAYSNILTVAMISVLPTL